MASVYPRKELSSGGVPVKIYYIKYREFGKSIRFSTGKKNKKEANEVLAKFLYEKDNHSQGKILCSKFLEKYININCFSKSKIQITGIKHKFDFLMSNLSDKFICDYSTEEFDSLLIMKLKTRSVYTARNYRAEYRAAFEQARKWKYVKVNPVIDCINIKLPEPDIITFSIEEINKFLSFANDTYKDLFLFTLYTGLRAGDLVNIKLEDIDLQNKIIKIGNAEHVSKNQKTNFIEIADNIIEIIQRNIMSNQTYLFETKRKLKYSTCTISNGFLRIVRAAELRKGLNHKALRKTFATILYTSGVPIKEVSRALHHSSERVTLNHYAKMIRGNYTGITNIISKAFEKAV